MFLACITAYFSSAHLLCCDYERMKKMKTIIENEGATVPEW